MGAFDDAAWIAEPRDDDVGTLLKGELDMFNDLLCVALRGAVLAFDFGEQDIDPEGPVGLVFDQLDLFSKVFRIHESTTYYFEPPALETAAASHP